MSPDEELALRRAGAFRRLERCLGEPPTPPEEEPGGEVCRRCRATVYDPPSMRWVCPMVPRQCPYR